MKKKTRNLIIAAVVALLVVAAAVTAILILGNKDNKSSAPTVKLYWNVEQEQYEDPASGMSLRNKNEAGEYMILVSADGEQQRLRCKDQDLVDKIDSAKIIGLSVDSDQLITQVYTLEELNYGKAVWKFYIKSNNTAVIKHIGDHRKENAEYNCVGYCVKSF